MKRNLLIIGIAFSLISCGAEESNSDEMVEEMVEEFENSDDYIEYEAIENLNLDNNMDQLMELKIDLDAIGKEEKIKEDQKQSQNVNLFEEISSLFNPDKFKCNCGDKLASKLKKLRPKNSNVNGFIPNAVSEELHFQDNSIALKYKGANALAHMFKYKANGNADFTTTRVRNVKTYENFSVLNYLELSPESDELFVYTMDCSGYLSAALEAAGGIGRNDVETAAKAALSSNGALMVVQGIMYPVIYSAIEGKSIFNDNSDSTLALRIEILEGIINAIPKSARLDNTEIQINANYKIITTSNSGGSQFNGEIDFQANTGGSFGFGSASSTIGGSGEISRSIVFKNYNTYILAKNIDQPVDIYYLKDIIKTISSLKKKLKK